MMTPEAIREWAAEVRQERDSGDAADRLDAIAAGIARLRTALYQADEGCRFTHLYDESAEKAKESRDGK